MIRRRNHIRIANWAGAIVATAVLTVLAIGSSRAGQPLTAGSVGPGAAVTVATDDGRSIKGTIQSDTPELLVVLPMPRPAPKPLPAVGESGGRQRMMEQQMQLQRSQQQPPPPEPVQLPWKSVERVSNGLTARLALDIWQAQHAAELCPTCHGERTVWCPVCQGTNHDPAAAAACKTCHGELLLPCRSVGEVDGKVPCPNACLRLTTGTWTKGPKNELWRKFPSGPNGAFTTFSQDHVGHVILVDFKAHTVSDAGVCPICGGTVLTWDAICHGTGRVPCPECLARKSAPPCPNRCDAGRVVCPTCGGTGLRKQK